jgi:2-amino-4-hydroxy-6-hydroxymethyldihydropteridine diphosphokinase
MKYFLSLGSNIQPEKNIPEALHLLRKELGVQKFSSVYETDPVGPAGNQKFWNLAAEIEFPANKQELIKRLREIESSLGRKREENKFAPRPIDIDVLPQPDYTQQAFIMIPLAEIAPEEKDAATGKTFLELAQPLKKEAEKFKKITF